MNQKDIVKPIICKYYQDFLRSTIGGNMKYVLYHDDKYLPYILNVDTSNYMPIFNTSTYAIPLKVFNQGSYKKQFIDRCRKINKKYPVRSLGIYYTSSKDNKIRFWGVDKLNEIFEESQNTNKFILDDYRITYKDCFAYDYYKNMYFMKNKLDKNRYLKASDCQSKRFKIPLKEIKNIFKRAKCEYKEMVQKV